MEHQPNGSGRKALNWIFGSLSLGFMAALGWFAQDYLSLRQQFTAHMAWSDERNKVLMDIKDEQVRRSARLSAIETSLAAINSRVLTGAELEVFALRLKAANPALNVPETR